MKIYASTYVKYPYRYSLNILLSEAGSGFPLE